MTFGTLFLLAAGRQPFVPLLKVESQETTTLPQNMAAGVNAEDLTRATRAQWLASCAAVCFLNTGPPVPGASIGYVLHSGAGAVSRPEFNEAMAVMRVPPNPAIRVVYAHPDDTEKGYQGQLKEFVKWGLADHQLLEVTNLVSSTFAMRPPAFVGY